MPRTQPESAARLIAEVEAELTEALSLGALWNPESFSFRNRSGHNVVLSWRNTLTHVLALLEDARTASDNYDASQRNALRRTCSVCSCERDVTHAPRIFTCATCRDAAERQVKA